MTVAPAAADPSTPTPHRFGGGTLERATAAARAVRLVGVMQLTDTLHSGGLERVAVNLANRLPRNRYKSYLCATRQEGPLAAEVAPDVTLLALTRTGRFDVRALRTLVGFIRKHEIGILHAHGTSLFIAVAAALLARHVTVIWHDHFGAYGIATRPGWVYRAALRKVAGVIVVNPLLGDWSKSLGVPAGRVWYLPNFVCDRRSAPEPDPSLPGRRGGRVVCVAKFRPQKDHLTLLRAWADVAGRVPGAHLLLVGSGSDDGYSESVRAAISRLGISATVTLLGERSDVAGILSQCDVGVLSSASEGFPLALIEYGMQRLAVVATNVGQCAEVLDSGAAGTVVEPGQPAPLAAALTTLLESGERRAALGAALHHRVNERYGSEPIMRRICAVYDLCRPAEIAAGA